MKKFFKGLIVTLLLVVACAFAGCFGETIPLEEGKSKMEESNYEVVEMTKEELTEYMQGIEVGAKIALRCTRESTKDMLIAVWFENEIIAKAFETAFEVKAEEINQKAADEGYVMEHKSQGRVFYYGTAKACLDFSATPPTAIAN